MTIAESAGTVDAHAATEATPSADTSQKPAPKTTGTAVLKNSGTGETPASQGSQESGSQAPASSQESSSQAPASQASVSQASGSQAPASQEPVSQASASQASGSQAPASEELTIQAPASRRLATGSLSANLSISPASMRIAPESFSLDSVATDTTNDAATYQTLTPGQQIDVSKVNSADGTVKLSADQIKDHFTGTLVNNDTTNTTSGKGRIKNTSNIPIGDDGSVVLTSTDAHQVYNTFGDLKPDLITGHQVANVSFEHDIDFSHNFSMTGALGIGTNSKDGADSVGIIFVPGDPAAATKGDAGRSLGLDGLKNAFGFVYDNYHNGPEDGYVADPGTADYFGWRTTDSNGYLQADTDTVVPASSLTLNARTDTPFNDFVMTYDAESKQLKISLGGHDFTRTITDTTSGYSISIAASTGAQTNNYAARIDTFNYTPKTAQVNVNFTTPTTTPLSTTSATTPAPVTANIGDTILVFSSVAAAQRALEKDPTLNPDLMTVLPTDADGNVYVVDGSQASTNGSIHYIGDDQTVSDGAYYSYVVTNLETQSVAVPVSLTFKATITPVDKATGKAISGINPIEVNAIAGKTTVVQIPGFTSTTITIPTPVDGQPVNYNLPVDMSTTAAEGTTTTGEVNPIKHYYTAAGETIDGTPVTANVTVGTNQSVTDALNATPIGEDGKPVTDGSTPAYTWSTVPNAAGTDSTDSTAPKDSKSILVPTKATLDKWLQTASDNQAKAKDYQKQTQDIYDKFVGLTGITPEQKAAAQKLLDSVNDMYAQLSTDNATAKDDLQAAEDATDPETIFEKGQAGYNAMANMDDTLKTFQDDLDNLTTTNDAAVASLATFMSWSQAYGQTVGIPVVNVNEDGFGATLTQAQKDGFNNPDYYYYIDATDSDAHVTPKNVGTYYFKLTDAGRTYLKSLTTNTNAGLYTSAALTITPVDATPTLEDSSLQYGGVAGMLPLANINYHLGTVAGDDDPALKITQDDFEIDDANGNKVEISKLQVGGKYTIRYTDAAQTTLKNDKNYNFTFGTAPLTVTPREVSIVAAKAGKTYGDSTDPALTLDNDSAKAALVNGDDVSSLGAALTRETGENVGSYKISGTATANQNYAVKVTDGTFTIAKKPITVTANNVNVDYDGTAHQVDQAGFKLDSGDDNKLVGTDTLADLKVTLTPSAETNAGTYTISGSSTAANYDVTVNDGTLTIAQKDATITADAATVGYGDTLPTFTVTNSDTGLKTTLDNTDFEIFDNKAKAVATGQLQAGGDYTIQLTQAAQDSLKTANPNYKPSFGANKLTVSQRAITVHIENGGKDYGVTNDPALTFTIPTTTAAGQTNGTLVDPDTQATLGVTLTRKIGNDAGTYNITGTAANDGNYKVSIENDGTFTIAPIAGTATVADTSVVYGDALSDDKVTVNGTDTSELSADNFEIVDTKTKSVVTADKLQVNGSYTVQLTQKAQDALSKANPNYTLSFVAGGLAVTKRPITVQMNNVTTTYDGKAHGANGFIVASGDKLVDGDSDGALGVTLDPISETDAGTYAITGKADSANYDVTLKDGALNITQADGNVVVTGTSVVYGDSLPSLLVSVNGATANKLSADNFEIVDTKTNAVVTADKLQANGTYTVQLTKDAQDKLSKDNSNYKLSFGTDAALTVAKRPITVQIKNVTTTYDGKAHGANGFVIATDVPNNALVDGDSNDALSVTLNPISETNVGSYTISGKDASANYDVTLKDGALNITQADGNVAVTGTSVVYGDSLPSLSVSVNGAAASELSADNFEIVDTKAKSVVTADKLQVNGNYTVQLTKAAQDKLSKDNSNYKLSFGTDALTVTKRPITVQINNVETTYDGTAHGANGFSIAKDDKLVNGDSNDALSVTLNPISETNVGTYTITGKDASANYDVTLKDGTLKIDQKAGNVAVTGTSIVYGNSLPSLSVSVNGAAASELNAENFEIVDTKTNSVVTTDKLQVNGSYTVQLTKAAQDKLSKDNSNYKLTFGTDAALTVTKRPVTVQVSDQQSYAGEANPQNDAKLTSGAFKDGEGVTDLNLTYSEPTNPAVGSYTIDATNGNTNYDVKVLHGQLTVLGKEKDAAGTTTITEKDAAGNVVKIDKQWPDGSHTTYTYDPATDKRTVSEQKDGKQVDQQELTSDASKVTLSDDANTSTTVTLDPTTKQPVFEHDTTETNAIGDTTTTKDADGNVVKVVKQWPDGNQTTYTYDPISGDRAVTEEKDGKPVDQQKITSDDAKTTLSGGDDVKTIVNTGKPGSQPTFEHDTTKTTKDDAGNVTATTKDDAGNVINVTKQWTDGSTTTYTYDPATGKQNVTEQKDGKTVDQKTITPDAPKATLSTGNGVETTVNAPKPGAEPTFDHETTKTDGDTTTTKDADGNVVKVVKQWPDDSQTTYTYDPATGNRTVTEQKDGKTDNQPIAKDTNKATVSAVDGAKTIVNAGQPGSQPTFEHDTTQTTKDDAGNVTATTKDDTGNVIDVTKQWTDGSTTKYTYDPATKTQTVTEQKDGKTVDQKTITPDDPKATLSTGNGVETTVNAPKPGSEPTFDHETTKTDGDTTTTKDANGNVVKVVKQWPDDSQTTYTYDPITGDRAVTEQKDGKPVDQQKITSDDAKTTLSSGDDVKTIVNTGKPGSQPTFEHDTTHTETDKSGNTTATTKDTDGNVVKVVKQWADGSQTTYTFDPATGKQTVTEQKDGKTVDQKTITPDKPKATLASGDGAETIVNTGKPGAEPTFEHDTTQTTTDKSGNVTTTTKDADGNVIEVTKQWTDGSKTIYTSDPKTGKQTVTEQKDGKTVDQKTITPDTKATLSSGNGVETIVTAGQPGSEPTFEHDATKTTTDKAGNVTTTTKDADGNVVKITKQWTDGSKTIYTSDPKTGKQTVTEQKDGQTVDEKTITPNAKATLASGDGVETIVTAGQPGTEPTFEHDATKTTTDKSGNVTTTTKDADGNVIKVTEQWTDGSVTTYTYDPATGKRVVTEQRDGKVVDQQTIDPDATKATLSSGAGVETIVNAGQPGSQPTFEHETIKTTTDKSGNVTATTTDANGNAVKVTKQWTDGSKTIYTYDPATGKRTVTEQRDGKTVDQQTIDPNASQVTLVDGAGGKVIVNFGKAGTEPSFTRQLAAQTGRRQVTVQKAGINQGKRASKQAKPVVQGKKSAQSATTNEVAGDVAVTGRVQAQPKAKSNQKQTELPQTGQKNESLLAEVGVVLLALLAVPFIRRRSH